jgi:hypothetical protein
MNDNFLAKIILGLLSVFLLVDSLNGFLVMSFGLDIKLSVIYKSIVLMLVALYLVRFNIGSIILALAFYFLLMLGESGSIFSLTASASKLGFLVQHITKVITPFLVFCFLLDRSWRDSHFYTKIQQVIKVNCIIFLGNMLVGFLGFGFSTYGGVVSATSIGVKGFFYAGNEISTLLVLFSGFYLSKTYLRSKLTFVFLSVFWVGIGLLISTKTAMLAVVILAFAIPVVFEGKRLFTLRSTPSILYVSLLLLILVQAVLLIDAFKDTLIFDRLEFFFQKTGIWGVLLSGRDIFFFGMWDLYEEAESVFSLLFGNGISYYADYIKYSVEMDLPDMFFWHGIIGVLITLFIFATLTRLAFTNAFHKSYPYGTVILLTNVLLLLISNLSGHVFTSGMLGFLWPCVAIMAKYSASASTHVKTSELRR